MKRLVPALAVGLGCLASALARKLTRDGSTAWGACGMAGGQRPELAQSFFTELAPGSGSGVPWLAPTTFSEAYGRLVTGLRQNYLSPDHAI